MNKIYWEYAGTRYKTKLKAIEASGGDIMSITFSAFDEAFLCIYVGYRAYRIL